MVTTHSETVFGLDRDNDRGLIDQDREGKSIIFPGRTDIENTQGLLSEGMVWFRNPISSDRTSGVNNVFGPHN